MLVPEAEAQLASFQVVDVREWYEWDAGHIEGALHIPIRKLAENLELIDQERPVLVVCQIGQRSGLAADWLRAQGYDSHNLEGGVEAWIAAGFPLVNGSGDEGAVTDGWAQFLPD